MIRRARGFTLLEVMVALLVLTIALAALIGAGSRYALDASYLRERTLAQWVASNHAAELRLQPVLVEAGTRNGRDEMLGRLWYWRARIENTPDPDLRRAQIVVATDARLTQPLVTLIVYLGRP
jgi:general secretion pathway protein I